jgi:hypothetical protein
VFAPSQRSNTSSPRGYVSARGFSSSQRGPDLAHPTQDTDTAQREKHRRTHRGPRPFDITTFGGCVTNQVIGIPLIEALEPRRAARFGGDYNLASTSATCVFAQIMSASTEQEDRPIQI